MVYSTQQKSVLNRVISESDRPLTAREILAEAQKELPHLGMATVYRALKQFQADGQARVVEIPGITPHYESAATPHHHFFCCVQCEKLFNLVGCVRGITSLAPEHFRVRRHEIVLYGDCQACLTAVNGAAPRPG